MSPAVNGVIPMRVGETSSLISFFHPVFYHVLLQILNSHEPPVSHLFHLSGFPDCVFVQIFEPFPRHEEREETDKIYPHIFLYFMSLGWRNMRRVCLNVDCVVFLFFCEGVCFSVSQKKKKKIKCSEMSLYSDILLSCSRRRRQYTKCTPTCIISTASPLVTSPFPQAFFFSSLTVHSEIGS